MRGEEQGVQGGTVEAFPDERSGGDDEERFIRVRVFQLGEGGGSLLCPHAAAQHDRFVAACGELDGEPFEVAGPLREHQAVSPRSRASTTSWTTC
jgi:hypothetical protein